MSAVDQIAQLVTSSQALTAQVLQALGTIDTQIAAKVAAIDFSQIINNGIAAGTITVQLPAAQVQAAVIAAITANPSLINQTISDLANAGLITVNLDAATMQAEINNAINTAIANGTLTASNLSLDLNYGTL